MEQHCEFPSEDVSDDDACQAAISKKPILLIKDNSRMLSDCGKVALVTPTTTYTDNGVHRES
jgi:hypothetical protein